MSSKHALRRTARWAAVGVFLSVATLGLACCALVFTQKVVKFAGQRNIIVWDDTTKTEHFIRHAKFRSDAKDLGFIAPTPSVPKLEEVDDKVFGSLAGAVDSFRRKVGESQFGCRGAATASDGPVEVIQEVAVAGYVATTLKANDPNALSLWMKTNGYASSPEIARWTDFYIKKGWLLTAFKVDSSSGTGETGLVKMSFTTDRPFNPYYVPKENFPDTASANDGLQLYFIGNGRYSPVHGPAELRQTGEAPLEDQAAENVKSELRLVGLPQSATITVFEDSRFPSSTPGDDVFFSRTGDQPRVPISQNTVFFVFFFGAIVVAITAVIRSLIKFSRKISC